MVISDTLQSLKYIWLRYDQGEIGHLIWIITKKLPPALSVGSFRLYEADTAVEIHYGDTLRRYTGTGRDRMTDSHLARECTGMNIVEIYTSVHCGERELVVYN